MAICFERNQKQFYLFDPQKQHNVCQKKETEIADVLISFKKIHDLCNHLEQNVAVSESFEVIPLKIRSIEPSTFRSISVEQRWKFEIAADNTCDNRVKKVSSPIIDQQSNVTVASNANNISEIGDLSKTVFSSATKGKQRNKQTENSGPNQSTDHTFHTEKSSPPTNSSSNTNKSEPKHLHRTISHTTDQRSYQQPPSACSDTLTSTGHEETVAPPTESSHNVNGISATVIIEHFKNHAVKNLFMFAVFVTENRC